MFTIKEFLDMDMVAWYKNLTGVDIPADRPIEYVSVNDPPLDDFIRKNELVISIATPYTKDDTLMTEFIEGLIEAEASLFLLAIPNNSLTLSQKNIEAARAGGLPILLIPWTLRFADIVETVLNKIHGYYNDTVDNIKVLQTDILNCFLDGNSIEDAVKIISNSVSCAVSIVDSSDHAIAGSSNIPDKTQIPLESNGHLYGYLCIDTFITQKQVALMGSTLSTLLSLWFYKDNLIEAAQSMAKDDLIWGLANGTDPDSENNQRTASLMDLHLSRTYACIVCRVELNMSSTEQGQKSWFESRIKSMCNIAMKTAKSIGREAMVTHQKNAIIIFLEVVPSAGKNQITKFLDTLDNSLKTTYRNVTLSWGISELKEGPTDYRNYYLHAKLASDICSGDTHFNNRYFYESTLIYSMMSTLSADEDFINSTYAILAPVIDYDKTRSTKLMDTLRAYLSYKNISETARKLDRHRQTLLYQLEKIEDLTGLSLKNNDEVFLLEVCMRLHMDFSSID